MIPAQALVLAQAVLPEPWATLANASPAVMLVIFLYLLIVKKTLALGREVVERDARIAALEAEKASAVARITGERDEFKGLLFHALNVADRSTSAAETLVRKGADGG